MHTEPLTEELGSVLPGLRNEALDSLNPRAVLELLGRQGVVLFRGYEASLEEFADFARQFGPVTWDVHDVSTTGRPMGFHSEATYTPNPPDLVWFYCLTPAAEGGQTTLCDGVGMLSGMDAALRDLFYEKRIFYRKTFTKQRWLSAAHTSDLEEATAPLNSMPGVRHYMTEDEKLCIEYVAPAIRRTRFTGEDAFSNTMLIAIDDPDSYSMKFEDGSEIPREVLDSVKRLSEELTVPIEWRPRDFLLIDNSRVMHGRRAYSDTRRDIKSIYSRLPD
jgi:alpha-ketoglutarate-dependent taurine dioxygenase